MKNKQLIGLMKGELSGKIMKEFGALRAKRFSYITDNNDGNKKAKATKKRVIKRKVKLKDYKNCLKETQLENKINPLEKIRLIQNVLVKTIINS